MHRFNVKVVKAHAVLLAGAVKECKQVETDWMREQREQILARVVKEKLDPDGHRELLKALRLEKKRLRAVGVLRGTASAYVLPHLHDLMAERGWTGRRRRPVPDGEQHGRPTGTHDVGYRGSVDLEVPDDLGRILVRACYWSSQPAVMKLRAWYARHGDHWRGQLHADRPYEGVGPSHADLVQRETFVGEVVTTGQVCREAIDRALRHGGKLASLPPFE